MTAMDDLDLYTSTAQDLKELLCAGKCTSVDLVKVYLAQIEKHNRKGAHLRAIICTAPYDYVIAEAQSLDDERARGKIRSSAHGIPIIVKVTENMSHLRGI